MIAEQSDVELGNLGIEEYVRVDELCTEFEAAWKAGTPRPIEEYPPRIEEPCRMQLVYELLRLEFAYRDDGSPLDFAAYRGRFAEYGPAVEQAISHHLLSPTTDATRRPEWHSRAVARRNAPPLPDDYEVLEEIARGGQGVVYKARQIGLDRLVAIKVLHADHDESSRRTKRFEREARMAAQLEHPNVVAVYEVGRHEGRPYLVMEYVPGRSLGDVVRQGPLNPALATEYVATAARAIDAAHRRGVLHRDVKPSNVLLDDEGRIRVTDFGLARPIDGEHSLTDTGDLLGTVNYMSPEQAAGRLDEVGPATDVYALGATLYELLTGRPPFHGSSFHETIRRVMQDVPVPPRRLVRHISPTLEAICLKCLEKKPKARYATAAALAEDLDRERLGETVSVEAPRARFAPPRRTLPIAAGVSTLVLAMLFALPFLWPPPTPTPEPGADGTQPPTTASLPAVGEWRRYDGDDWWIRVRGVGDRDGYSWLLIESHEGSGGDERIESGLVAVDAKAFPKSRKLNVVEGFEWIGRASDADAEQGRKPAQVVPFDRDGTRIVWGDDDSTGLHGELKLLYDADVIGELPPNRGEVPKPVLGESRDPYPLATVIAQLEKWTSSPFPATVARLPEVGEGVRATGRIEHHGLNRQPILYEVVLRGLAEEEVGGRLLRWICVEVRSGRDARSFPETAVVLVDPMWSGYEPLRIHRGWEFRGQLADAPPAEPAVQGNAGPADEPAVESRIEELVPFREDLRPSQALAPADPEEAKWRLAARDVLKLVFDADLTASQELFDSTRNAFVQNREILRAKPTPGLVSLQFDGRDLPDGTESTLELPDRDGRLSTNWTFQLHDDVPAGWVFVRAEMLLPGKAGPAFAAHYGARNSVDDFDPKDWPAVRQSLERWAPKSPDVWDRVALPDTGGTVTYEGDISYLTTGTFHYEITLSAVRDELVDDRPHRWIQVEIRTDNKGRKHVEQGIVLLDVEDYAARVNVDEVVAKDAQGRYRGYIEADGVVVRFHPEKDELAEILEMDELTPEHRLGFREVFSLLFAAEVDTSEPIQKLRYLLALGRSRKADPTTSRFDLTGRGPIPVTVHRLPPVTVAIPVFGTCQINYEVFRSEVVPFGFADVMVDVRPANGLGSLIYAKLQVKTSHDDRGKWTMDPEPDLVNRVGLVPPPPVRERNPRVMPDRRPAAVAAEEASGRARLSYAGFEINMNRGDRVRAKIWYDRLLTIAPGSDLADRAGRRWNLGASR